MIAFVHIAKTGGRTVEGMLRSAYGAGHCDATLLRPRPSVSPERERFVVPKYRARDVADIGKILPGLRSLGGHHVALWSEVEKVFPDVRYLVMLRDPLKRGASHYQYHVRNDDYTELYGFRHFSWERWVEWEVHHNHQLKMLSATVDTEDAMRLLARPNTFVGLLERFDESLLLFRRLFAPDLNIAYRRKNSADDNEIAHRLLADDRAVAQIREMYAREFPLYDYVRNELYPGYVRAYGAGLAADLEEFQRDRARGLNRLNLLRYHAHRRLVFLPRVRRLRSGRE